MPYRENETEESVEIRKLRRRLRAHQRAWRLLTWNRWSTPMSSEGLMRLNLRIVWAAVVLNIAISITRHVLR